MTEKTIANTEHDWEDKNKYTNINTKTHIMIKHDGGSQTERHDEIIYNTLHVICTEDTLPT